jgi:hypothetical protein
VTSRSRWHKTGKNAGHFSRAAGYTLRSMRTSQAPASAPNRLSAHPQAEAPTSAMPELLTTSEAAALLRIHPQTLSAMRVSGGGPLYHKIGRRVLYARLSIAQFVAANTRVSTSEESPSEQRVERSGRRA